MKKFWIFLIFVGVASGLKIGENVDKKSQKVINQIVEIIEKWNSNPEKENVRDITIIDLEDHKDFIDDLRQKITADNPLLVINPKACTKTSKTRKSAFIIIITEQLDLSLQMSIGSCIYSPFFSPQANIIFVSTTPKVTTMKDFYAIGRIFIAFKIINNLILNGNDAISINILTSEIHVDSTDLLLTDKLLDMRGYVYKLSVDNTSHRFTLIDDVLQSFEINIMNITVTKQNAKILKKPFVISQRWQLERELAQSDIIAYDGNQVALRNSKFVQYYKLINSYQTDGYCAIVRYPYHESFLDLMFSPFDEYFWLFFVLSLICACIVWKLYRGYRDGNTVGYFVFGIYAAFFLQAIPFRRNRPMQTFLLNVFVFMLLIIGNAYQGVIISILIGHNPKKYIQSVEDIVDSEDLRIYADFGLANAINESYPELYAKLNILSEWVESDAYFCQFRDQIVQHDHNQVLIVLCSYVNKLLDVEMCHGTARDYHYVMTDPILSFYSYMVAARRSPFVDRINEYSLRIFEGGIQQYWKVMNNYITYNPHLKEFEGINFVKFSEYFIVLYIGFGLATFAFIVEIICGRYGEQLKVVFIDLWKLLTRSNRVRPFQRPA